MTPSIGAASAPRAMPPPGRNARTGSRSGVPRRPEVEREVDRAEGQAGTPGAEARSYARCRPSARLDQRDHRRGPGRRVSLSRRRARGSSALGSMTARRPRTPDNAETSASWNGVPCALTRTHATPPAPSQRATSARAASLASTATASSRSQTTTSAPLAAALANRSPRSPGTNSHERALGTSTACSSPFGLHGDSSPVVIVRRLGARSRAAPGPALISPNTNQSEYD